MIVIGSHALKINGIDNGIPAKDYDFVCSMQDAMLDIGNQMKGSDGEPLFSGPIDGGKKWVLRLRDQAPREYELTWDGSTAAMFMDLVHNDPETIFVNHALCVPSLNALYTLKMSHRYLRNSPAFLKTMRDIHLMRAKGAEITDYWKEFFTIREKETYNYSHPSLMRSKNEFFSGDGVQYVYDHDSIHEAVKIHDKPAYTYFKPPNSDVMVSKEMWDAAPYAIKVAAGYEESCVLALERSQIPYPKTPRKKSFDMALMKVCTSITSGWFREFCWENYHAIQSMYSNDYVDKFRAGVASGIVKPYKG